MYAEVYHFVPMDLAPNRIRELRMAKPGKWSQQKLADLIGVSKVTISELESGKMQFTQDYMRRIAAALDCAPADLLPVTENPEALSLEERRLINQLRAANEEQREQVHKVADVIAPFTGPETTGDQLLPRKRA